ncbi:MAG: ATP-binding cassette domain-containing protein [Bacilli bacterium]|nr:ATP-binding cassette domain-containing protein [Bacilli bacterium]
MIEIANLTKKFCNHIVLDNISFKMPDTGLVVIEGENGSGKTTLLNILDLMDDDFSGRYILDGVDVKTLKEKNKSQLRQEYFSYVCQKHNLVRYLSKEDNVQMKSLIQGKRIKRQKKEDWHKLSQGQQEIIVLKRELLPGKNVYLLDEVTASLDEKHQQWVISTIAELSRKSLVIIACHDLDLKGQADLVYHLKKGKVEMVKGSLAKVDEVTRTLPLNKHQTKVPFTLARKRWKASWILDCFMVLISIMTTALYLAGIQGCRPNIFGELLSASKQATSILVQRNDLLASEDLLNHFNGFSYRSFEYRVVFSNDIPADGKIYCNSQTYHSLSTTNSSDLATKQLIEEKGYVIDDSITGSYFFMNDACYSSSKDGPYMFSVYRNVLMKDGVSLQDDVINSLYYLNQKAFQQLYKTERVFELEDDVFYMQSVKGDLIYHASFEFLPCMTLYQDYKEKDFNILFPNGVTVSSLDLPNTGMILVSDKTMDKLLTSVSIRDYVLVELGHNTFQQLSYISRHHLCVADPYGSSSMYSRYNALIESTSNKIGNTTYNLLIFVMIGVYLIISALIIIAKKAIYSRDDWILQANGLSKNTIWMMDLLLDIGVFVVSIPFGFVLFTKAIPSSTYISLDILFTTGLFVLMITALIGLHLLLAKRWGKRK